MSALARSIGSAVAATLVAGCVALGTGEAAALPAPEPRVGAGVADLTRAAPSKGTAGREVALLQTVAGKPTVTRLRTDSPAAAAALAATLDAEPGVAASVNHTYRASDRVLSTPTLVDVPGSAPHGSVAGEQLGAQQWAFGWVGYENAWHATTGGGVTVAVLDTGVDASHPDIAPRLLPSVNLVNDGNSADAATDSNAHGTMVSGVIAAELNGAGVAGGAPGARILPVRVLNASGEGDDVTVAQGIVAAADRGATVINLSLGGPGSSPVLDAAVSYATSRGALIVASAGNDALQGNPVEYPAAAPSVLAVGAMDQTGHRASFSNTGAYVDLTAPGVGIVTDYPALRLASASGTSFSAPMVSAAAALLRAAAPSLTWSAAADVLTSTAQDDTSGDGRDDEFGYGLVRIDRALVSVLGPVVPVSSSPAPSSSTATPTPSGSSSPTPTPTGPGVPSPTVTPLPTPTPTATPTRSPAPVAPRSLRASSPRRGTVAASWASWPGAVGVTTVRARVSFNGGRTWFSWKSLGRTTHALWTGIRPGTVVTVQVRAVTKTSLGAVGTVKVRVRA